MFKSPVVLIVALPSTLISIPFIKVSLVEARTKLPPVLMFEPTFFVVSVIEVNFLPRNSLLFLSSTVLILISSPAVILRSPEVVVIFAP